MTLTVNTEADLEMLPHPAVYEMRKVVKGPTCVTTSVAHVIKVDNALYLMLGVGSISPSGVMVEYPSYQMLDKRSPAAILEKYAGFDFITAEMSFHVKEQ